MPYWIPKTRKLEDDIAEEQLRLAAVWSKELKPEPQLPDFAPTGFPMPQQEITQQWQPRPIEQPQLWQPQQIQPMEQPQPVVSPRMQAPISSVMAPPRAITEKPKDAKKPDIVVPFWKRALQVFAAPFEWIDQNLIKPGWGAVGTGLGFVEQVPREPGEDFWEWKKRSWAGWESPGIDINVPWSEDPMRLDVRGVMELAPWLLIPGAGQVGGGIRGARGIAGILGKVSKPLGYAVEYSPWGIAEKGVGLGFKGIGKVTGKVSTKAGERLYGKMPEPVPPTPAVVRFTNEFGEVVKARRAFLKAKPTELTAKQSARLREVATRYERGDITAVQRQALEETALEAGSLKAQFAITPHYYNKADMEELFAPIYKAAESNWSAKDAARALNRLLLKGEIPEPRHFIQFSKAYGKDFAIAAKEFSRFPSSLRDKILDALNLPRSVLASGDLSATFRQGLILMLTHPLKAPRAFARQLKAFASEKISLEMDDTLRSHRLFREAVDDGVEFTAIRRGAELAAKEEAFTSNLAQRLPGVRRSERAFTTFLNEMRMGAYESAHGAMRAQGASRAEMKLMGGFINMASGRGTLPANLDRYAPMLNTVLFSARYQMSTLQMPRQLGRMLLSKNPYMRKEAAKALITFVGGGSSLLALFQATGRGKVEIDPRSGDFGKIIIGKTRLDIWRGYVQYARFLAQMLTSERKSAYGNMNKVQRSEIASRFLQSKASPAFGLMVDLLKGESYMGEPLFNETTGFIKTARDRLLPLAMQDVIDAMEQSGTNGLWTAAPATLGVGVLTYVNDLVRVKERIARDMGYKTWDEIDPKTQREIQNRNVELQVAYIDFDRQVMGTAWGDWRNAGAAVEDVFRENVDLATAQYRATGDGYTFRAKIGTAFDERRGGYAAREKETRFEDIVNRLNIEDTAESLTLLGPEQLAIKTYNDALWSDDMYDEFGDYRFDEAELRKQQLRDTMGEEMFNYVEEYRGLKYEDFPSEYQELVQAKIALRPYWQIKNRIIDMFGKMFAESSRGQSLITKLRQALKRQNPEIARYIELFYTQ